MATKMAEVDETLRRQYAAAALTAMMVIRPAERDWDDNVKSALELGRRMAERDAEINK